MFNVLLLVLFLVVVLLYKACHTVTIKELRRRARGIENTPTNTIYKLASYGESLRIFLWLVGGLSAALLFYSLAVVSWFLIFILLLLGSWLVLSNKQLNTNGVLWKLAALMAKPTILIVDFLQPVLSRLAGFLKKLLPVNLHTGIYDKEDLLDLLNNQNNQIDNRIAEEDLRIAFGALTFGDMKISDHMIPRRVVKFVAATDSIGPLLMDELHKSGLSRFPVVSAPTKEANPDVIGTLYIKDLIDHQDKGKVFDVMKKDASFINEDQTLREALNVILKTQHHLIIVVNNFEEISGIISLEDVMEQILGDKIVDETDKHEDLREVAAEEAAEAHENHDHQPA
jgi:CBS domain containing-hemolysin-like protein